MSDLARPRLLVLGGFLAFICTAYVAVAAQSPLTTIATGLTIVALSWLTVFAAVWQPPRAPALGIALLTLLVGLVTAGMAVALGRVA